MLNTRICLFVHCRNGTNGMKNGNIARSKSDKTFEVFIMKMNIHKIYTSPHHLLTKPRAKARSYSADSKAADKKSKTGIFPFSVYVLNCDFNGTDLK